MNSKILVFGGLGQLGQSISRVCKERGISSVIFLDEVEGDILNLAKMEKLFEEQAPEFVINCAAYTAVDKAEDEPALCEKINKTGAVNVANCCERFNATLLHISTDFVFDGKMPKLLNEEDLAEPINVYGKTKLEGEVEVSQILAAHYIIRTSWLYSEYANNFVKTMLRLSAGRDELSVIVDQVGTPTYAVDLASVLLDIVASDKKAYGTYHYSNEGVASWYDFAKAIFDLSETEITLHPIPGSAYPTKATRPAFSVMDKAKIKTVFNLTIPYWRDSLVNCINAIKTNNK